MGFFFKTEGNLKIFQGWKKKNLNFVIFERTSQDSMKMRNVENGKKWGRLHETLRSWHEGGRSRSAAVQEMLQLLVGK